MSFRTYALNEVLELIIDHRGKTPKKLGFEDFDTKGIPVLSAKHVKTDELVNLDQMRFSNDEMYRKWMPIEVDHGDVILTSEAPLGEVFYIDDDQKYILGQRVFGLRARKEILDPLYLVAWLTSKEGQDELSKRSSGSTVLGIKQSELRKIEISIPSLNKQKNISNIRYELTKKIEKNNQINETLEAMAQAIFKSWFVDFDPVKAKVEAKAKGLDDDAINRAAMRVIASKTDTELDEMQAESPAEYTNLQTTASHFPDELVESELGMIPKGWKLSTMGDEISLFGGGTPSTKNNEYWKYKDKDGDFTVEGDIHWSTPRDMSGLKDKILLDTDRKITEAGLATISSGLLPIDTVLMSSRAPVGYLALAKIPTAINQGFIAMVCDKKLPPEYVLQLVSFKMDEIKQRSSGTTFAEISRKNFSPIQILVPNESVLKNYVQHVRAFYQAIENLIKENINLVELRDSLLPKLLSGEIEV